MICFGIFHFLKKHFLGDLSPITCLQPFAIRNFKLVWHAISFRSHVSVCMCIAWFQIYMQMELEFVIIAPLLSVAHYLTEKTHPHTHTQNVCSFISFTTWRKLWLQRGENLHQTPFAVNVTIHFVLNICIPFIYSHSFHASILISHLEKQVNILRAFHSNSCSHCLNFFKKSIQNGKSGNEYDLAINYSFTRFLMN